MIRTINLPIMLIAICLICSCSSNFPLENTVERPSEITTPVLNNGGECLNNPRATQYELNQCSAQNASNNQEELDVLLEIAQKNLPEEMWKQLEANQLEWDVLKEKDCDWAASFWESGSMAPMQYWGCIGYANRQRIEFVKVNICIAGQGSWEDDVGFCENLLGE